MIISMSAELMATIVGTVVTIVALVVTIALSSRSTNKILKATQKTLDKLADCMHKLTHIAEKISADTRANVKMHGCTVAENITLEEAEKLGEVFEYSPSLKVAYYKPKK